MPGETLFGYYDKTPWSSDGRYFLLHGLHSRNRTNSAAIICLDRMEHRLVQLAETSAWNFQQGAMLQWACRDGNPVIVFNDFEGDSLVGRVVDLHGQKLETLPLPIQAIHPGTGQVISLNCNRLLDNRPDYAYVRRASNFAADDDHDGVFALSLSSPTPRLLVPLAWFRAHRPRGDMAGARHWLNHAMFSPSGEHLLVMHRWGLGGRRLSRLYTIELSTGHPTLLLDQDMISHYHWLDDASVIAYCRSDAGDRYYRLDVRTRAAAPVQLAGLQHLGDGHPAVSSATGLVATDTYPNRRGVQCLSLFAPPPPPGGGRRGRSRASATLLRLAGLNDVIFTRVGIRRS